MKLKKSSKKIGSKRRKKTSRSLRSGLAEWHDHANDFETCLNEVYQGYHEIHPQASDGWILRQQNPLRSRTRIYGVQYFKRWALQRGIALTKTAKDDQKWQIGRAEAARSVT